MYTAVCGVCLAISLVVLGYMAQKNYNNIDPYQWTIFLFVPVTVMAYWLKSQVTSPEAARALLCFAYLDSTFMFTTLLFAIMRTLRVVIRPWTKIVVYGLAGIHLGVVGLCFNGPLYYSSVEVIPSAAGNITRTGAGPLMPLHFLYLGLLLLWLIALFFSAVRRRGTYPKVDLFIYLLLPSGAFLLYMVETLGSLSYTLLPVLYTASDLVLALRYDRMHLHDISALIAESRAEHELRGYVALRPDKRFLCCNRESYRYLPVLREQRVNRRLPKKNEACRVISDLVDSFERDGITSAKFQQGSMTCVCQISYLTIQGSRNRQGYFLEIIDGTQEQKAFDLMASYSEDLAAEVQKRTEEIEGMRDKLVLGMSDMVENRDSNTGGHVKRTSDIIKILVEEIQKQGEIALEDQMALDIVRAAPTHDLGKIMIDNAILNKPGRFTPEEYEIMKTHSTRSGEMVKILLEDIESDRFVRVAYNVARYHHERWDGKGYPEGLVGTMIPLEARVMAVADVYDALVSKRVYKEPMSFEKSAAIMCEGMGTQFDPNMEPVFLGCRERLERYYLENDR